MLKPRHQFSPEGGFQDVDRPRCRLDVAYVLGLSRRRGLVARRKKDPKIYQNEADKLLKNKDNAQKPGQNEAEKPEPGRPVTLQTL